jgi:GTPase Era involved in 16S rRNA processing
MKSETSVCNTGERRFDERRLIVVDTPGLFDTNADPTHVAKEIAKAVMISAPGPHCFIVTISARNRFTEEAQKTIDILCNIFGGNVLEYCVIVFTNEDAIIDEDMAFEHWLPQQISQLPGLAHLIKSCGRRCMAFNNKSKSPGEFDGKVRQLVSMIDQMVAQNNGRIYTNDMYKEAEAAARQREAEQLRQAAEKDAALRNEIDEVRRIVRQNWIFVDRFLF